MGLDIYESDLFCTHSVHCNLEHFWKTVSVDVVWLVSANLFAYVNPNPSWRTLEVSSHFCKVHMLIFLVLFWFLVFI